MKAAKKLYLVAFLFAIITAVLFFRYLNELQTRYQPHNLRSVVMAKKDIAANQLIGSEDIMVKKIPAEYVCQEAFNNKEAVVGRMAVNHISSGEQVAKNRVLNEKNRQKKLTYSIPKGKRAISVAINDVTAVSGFIQPGDQVDVLSTADIPVSVGGGEQVRTYCLLSLQDITVLAVGKTLPGASGTEAAKKNSSSGDTRTITLAVSPREAQMLTMAAERGRIRLMLRSPGDQERPALPALELRNLVTGGE